MSDNEYDRSERLRRARALQDESVDAMRGALLRGAPGAARREGTTAAGAATSTLAGLGFGGHQVEPDRVRDGLKALGGHLDAALEASMDGSHKTARRHIRAAMTVHKGLAELLGGE